MKNQRSFSLRYVLLDPFFKRFKAIKLGSSHPKLSQKLARQSTLHRVSVIANARRGWHRDVNRAVVNVVDFGGVFPTILLLNLVCRIMNSRIDELSGHHIRNQIGALPDWASMARVETRLRPFPAVLCSPFTSVIRQFVFGVRHWISKSRQSAERVYISPMIAVANRYS